MFILSLSSVEYSVLTCDSTVGNKVDVDRVNECHAVDY